MRSGLLSVDQLLEVALFARQYQEVQRRYPDIAPRRAIYETVRRMINFVVTDLIENSRSLIAASGIKYIEDVRCQTKPLMAQSPEAGEKSLELKRFLRQNLYAHERVSRMMREADKIVRELFETFMQDPRRMPPQYQEKLHAQETPPARARIVADYIAGMTDRYAMREHARLFHDPARNISND